MPFLFYLYLPPWLCFVGPSNAFSWIRSPISNLDLQMILVSICPQRLVSYNRFHWTIPLLLIAPYPSASSLSINFIIVKKKIS